MSETSVIGVVGSLREESRTRVAVETALTGATERGARAELIDLRKFDLPPLDPDIDDQGDSDRFRATVDAADAIVLGTPMYHGSYSGVVKNALDHCGFDEFEGKTVGLLAVSGGAFPIAALDHLRSVCRALNAWVLPYQAAVPRSNSSITDETFVDENLQNRIRTLGERVVAYSSIEPDPSTFESGQNKGG